MLTNYLTQKVCVIGLCVGMFASPLAFANNSSAINQARFDTGGPILGGTREGSQQYRVETEGGRVIESPEAHYRTTIEVGSPLLGGTREGMHRDRIMVNDNPTVSQQNAHTEHSDNLIRGTRG
ncbi:hypothetical protein HXW73_13745 [Halomonas sp. SH5A2]|uniref:hypothetical protein n=1 Tax=Halomonas sp. SH5A2 TaxID=2749040 RepID=UPI0016405E6B|nr:hypothetical protein [Halomonas sp. SH5A2]QNI03910.1 hypothetical protein HXW73_13745 [Halomonas sp. SH5A2]